MYMCSRGASNSTQIEENFTSVTLFQELNNLWCARSLLQNEGHIVTNLIFFYNGSKTPHSAPQVLDAANFTHKDIVAPHIPDDSMAANKGAEECSGQRQETQGQEILTLPGTLVFMTRSWR